MKHSALLTALLTTAVLTTAPAPVSAQNVAGMWEISYETGRGTRTQTLTLAVDGMTLTGTVTFTGCGRGGGGGGGGGPQSSEISDGNIDGRSSTVTATRTFGDHSVLHASSGPVDVVTLPGTSLGGGLGGGEPQPRPFTGNRPAQADLRPSSSALTALLGAGITW